MKQLLTAVLALGGALGSPSDDATTLAPEGTLYFFFAHDSSLSPAAAKALPGLAAAHKGELHIRPVLLVEDWKAFKKSSQGTPLSQTVRELSSLEQALGLKLSVFDEEGLRLARAWKLSRLPAFVLIAHDKAHVVYGTRIDLKDLSECGQ